MKVLPLCLVCVLFLCPSSGLSLIPMVCKGQRFCCPVPSGAVSPCGIDLGRGKCADPAVEGLYTPVPSFAQPFEQICFCSSPWYGADCGRCRGPNCPAPLNQPRVRRDFSSMSTDDQNSFVAVLAALKQETGVYTARHPNGTWEDMNTYDAHAATHWFVAENNPAGLDYAHNGPALLPWHRGQSVYFEDELVLHGLPLTFGLPYWSWEVAGTADTLFQPNAFGTTDPVTHQITQGHFRTWRVWNGSATNTPLTRCLGCNAETNKLPTEEDAQRTVQLDKYDSWPWDAYTAMLSFRAAAEGHVRSASSQLAHAMHNLVHMWINGTISVVPQAAADPVFWLLHANLDRLFELWITLHPGALFRPWGYAAPGHNAADAAVYLFPPMPLRRCFQGAQSWGYEYEARPTGQLDQKLVLGLTLGLGIPGLIIAIVLIACICVRRQKGGEFVAH
jgi:tyrosinase